MSAKVIGLYPQIKETVNYKPVTISTFLQFVKDGQWQDQVLKYRAMPDAEEKKEAKKRIPYVTISGTFTKRNENGLDKHSGFIAIDIDNLTNIDDVRAELGADAYTYALFTSVGGYGLCWVVKINPKAHIESYNYLSEYLYKTYEITDVDDKCKDISRARFVSYDPDVYVNEDSQLCHIKPEPKKKKEPYVNYVFINDDFNKIIESIKAASLDLTADYGNWIKTGFALANKFGESGRDYFHAISQYNGDYKYEIADKKYSHILRTSRNEISIGFIYFLAKNNGIQVYSKRTESLLRAAKTAKGSENGLASVKENLIKDFELSEDEIKELEPVIEQVLNEKVVQGEENIVLDIKEILRQNFKLRRNLVTRNIELDGKPIDDITINSIFIFCRTRIKNASKDLVSSILFSDFTEAYNPFAEFLDKKIADYYPNYQEQGLLDRVISCIKTDTENAPLFIKKWLVSMIASINGKHSPLMLVLTGGQNTGKTHFFRHLLPGELHQYYAESKLDLGKDDEILMTKKLIIADDEMGGKSKQEEKKLKEMTSKQTFSIREPYGRVSVDLTRLAMLCGTSNVEEILNDPTGNRRILPVRVLDINRELYNSIDKGALFFECFLEYEKGYDCNLSTSEIKLLNDSTTIFNQSSSEEELVFKYYGHPDDHPGQMVYAELTNTEILSKMQTNSNIRLSQTKLGMILKKLKFQQKHIKVGEGTKRIYVVFEKGVNL